MTRVFAYIFSWRCAFSKVELTSSEGVTAVEIKGGLKYIIFNIQHLYFNEEISKLLKCELIRSPKVLGLSPFLDISDGIEIMQVGGRLSQANVPYEVKHPILLPNSHVVINALFEHVHRSNMHAGAHAICSFVRQQYWFINARKVARRRVRSCIACFRQRLQRANQIMGALQSNRVQIGAHPFERAGLDFAGPLWMHYNQRGHRPTKVSRRLNDSSLDVGSVWNCHATTQLTSLELQGSWVNKLTSYGMKSTGSSTIAAI